MITGAVRLQGTERGAMRRNRAAALVAIRFSTHADAAVPARHRARMATDGRFSAAC
jgi:hypothetical protein